jgi:hypothetical protein
MSIFSTRAFLKFTPLFLSVRRDFLCGLRCSETNWSGSVCGPYNIWYQVSPEDYAYVVDYMISAGVR